MTEKIRSILIKSLQDTNKVFRKHNIQLWLDSGTLLGAIRDQDFIPWDKDIDLGCWKSNNDFEIKQILKEEFIKLGYNVFLHDHYLNIHLFEYNLFLN